jgi:hypothetical protein
MNHFNSLTPHAEEGPQGRVSKHEAKASASPFETARSAPPPGEELGRAR